MIKIGVIGAGHLGKIHIKILKNHPLFELVGIFDSDLETAKKVSSEFEIPHFETIEKLISLVDAIDIVTPTTSHFEIAKKSLRNLKHTFIEKPITHSLPEAQMLVNMVKEAGVVGQVGHVERFNPAMLSLQGHEINPLFIECHRLAMWNPRGTDVSVVLDLMIHDIDIILKFAKSGIKRIHASGVAVISETPDIANARIEFHNGCVANITASRISLKNMRKMRIFQKNSYIGMDFLERKAEIMSISGDVPGIEEDPRLRYSFELGDIKKHLLYEQPILENVNAIEMELTAFAESIKNKKDAVVSFSDGTEALKVAYMVLEKINPNEA